MMGRISFLAASWVFLMAMAMSAQAAGMREVNSKFEFESLVDGRKLTALGVKLQVYKDGKITGRAFGKAVSGSWTWQSGYFCRNLTFGSKALDPNCQAVFTSDGRIRFVSDRGTGEVANLRIR